MKHSRASELLWQILIFLIVVFSVWKHLLVDLYLQPCPLVFMQEFQCKQSWWFDRKSCVSTRNWSWKRSNTSSRNIDHSREHLSDNWSCQWPCNWIYKTWGRSKGLFPLDSFITEATCSLFCIVYILFPLGSFTTEVSETTLWMHVVYSPVSCPRHKMLIL